MNENTAIEVVRDNRAAHQVQAAPAPAPTSLLQALTMAAADPRIDLAKVKELYAMVKEQRAYEAEQAYNEAFAKFKSEAIVILKNKDVTDGPLKGKSYAEIHSVVNALTPPASKHGLSFAWRITKDEKDWIEVTCTLKHASGHSESVSFGGPPDAGGAKNAMQARASTLTYLERYTLKAVTGTAEQGDDNDGNKEGNGDGKRLDENTYADLLASYDVPTDEASLFKAHANAYRIAEKAGDARAIRKFTEKKDARKKALGIK